MGKNLKGKECGRGIHQRKDGRYSARFLDKTEKDTKNISIPFQMHATGSRMPNM